MKLLFLSWRDIKNPKAGGAEVYTHEMIKRLVTFGHQVDHISPAFEGGHSDEVIDGVRYIRHGNSASVIPFAHRWHHDHEYDLIIDQSNTHQFFSPLWKKKNQKHVFFIHQLTREIWFHNCKFPMNVTGYMAEPFFLRLHKNEPVLTVSDSTRNDLIDYGFKEDNIHLIPEGIDFVPWEKEAHHEKEKEFTFIYVGRFVKYKGVEDALKAFAEFHAKHPNSKMWLVGKVKPKYKKELEKIIAKHGVQDKVKFWGFVSAEMKLELMSRAHCIMVPSQREGWGLIITEANAVGTPAIVYDSPGLRDAVQDHVTGLVCDHNSAEGLKAQMKILYHSPALYELLRENAYQWSKEFHWDTTGAEAHKALLKIHQGK